MRADDMYPFAVKEMRRLGTLLTQTDPRTDEYLILLRSIECFTNTAGALEPFMVDVPTKETPSIEDMGNVTPFQPPVEEITEDTTEDSKQDDSAEVESNYTLADIRKALTEAKKTGTNVAEFIKSYGVDNVTAIPASKYPEIMAKLGK